MIDDEVLTDLPSHNEAIIRTMTRYDMTANPDEAYYARQYLHWIIPELEFRFPNRNARVLDLGCGQGRLAIPIASWASGKGEVVGVDLTGPAIEKARENAGGLDSVSFVSSDILQFLRVQGDSTWNVVLLIEVTFFLPSWREVLGEIARVLKPGGVAFVSFRSQYYNLLQTVWSWRWDAAMMSLEKREGYLWGKPVWYTWQTPEDIKQILSSLGLNLLAIRGIGVCSGLEEDPLGAIVRPSQLPEEQRERLMIIECAVAEQYAACGRYILTTAEKPLGSIKR